MQIIFIPTEDCNLKCWYCSRDCHKKNYTYKCHPAEFSNLLNWVEAQEPEELDFEFFGGEPTTHPQLRMMAWMVAERFPENLVRLEVLTNLVKPAHYYYNFPEGIKFSCSYHSDSMNGDKWMNRVRELNDIGRIGDVKMVMTPENEEYIADMFMRYRDNDFRIYEILPQEQLEGTEWAEGLKEKYRDYIFDYIGEYRPRTNYKGMVCTAGYKISEEGYVYHCWRKFNDPDSKPIANAFMGTPTKQNIFHICSYDDCDVNDVEFTKMTTKEFVRWTKSKSKK